MYTEDQYVPSLQTVDFYQLAYDEGIKYTSISERLVYFRRNFVNVNNQFKSKIGENYYIFSMESYDSSSIYKKFFYYEVGDGIMITSSNPKYGNINLLMEIGPEIHINYYFKYSVTDTSKIVNLDREEWIAWLSLLAFIVGSRKVVIHSNYIINYDKNDTIPMKQMKTRYTYSQNIYDYMKYKRKMFNYIEITPNFEYILLDYLEGVQIYDIVKETDKDELYRIYKTTNLKNIKEFYLFIVENFPKYINTLIEKLEPLYLSLSNPNPFDNISYTLDAWNYLYNRNIIKQIPSEKEFMIKKGSFKSLIGDKKIPKFKNRLRKYLINE